jgi:flagellar hook-associated protein 2
VGTASSATSGFSLTPGFTGISQYSSDFQAELTKAAQIANIPINLLQRQDSAIISKETALGTISSDVDALATSVKALGTLAAGQALGATSSNPSAVSVSNSGATAAATHTINSITSAATAASERSNASYSSSAPVSSGTLTLVVGGQAHTFSLTQNNLNGLSDAINGLGAGVTASIVSQNGTSFLSLTNSAGPTTLQLFDGTSGTGSDLLTNTGNGTEQSAVGYSDPAATPVSQGTMTLQYGSQTLTFQLASNDLAGVENAINGLNAGVTASILTTPTGNYLSVSANSTGGTTLKLFDGANTTGTDLLTTTNQGTNAVFQLDGIGVDQPGNVVNNIVPGLTFTILGSTNTPVTLSLASDPTQLSSALQDFVTKYNTVQTDIQAQTGTSGGPLAGATILSQIRNTLQQTIGYTASTGSVQSLADLGVEFSDTGVASFNQTTFNALSASQISDAFKYIGSTNSGLGRFSAALAQFSDPVTGLIQSEVSGLKQTDQNLQNQINTLTARASAQQTALTNQLEAADALQAELQQQQQQLTASLQGLSLVLYGQNPVQAG